MGKRYRISRVKADWAYTVEELAERIDATPQTVWAWIKAGLPVIDEQRPFLILGWQFKDYFAAREAEKKRPLLIGEFFCFRCKRAARAAFGLVEYVPSSATHGRITAFCAHCEGPCGRVISTRDLPLWHACYPDASNAVTEA